MTTCSHVKPSSCSECYTERHTTVAQFMVQSYLMWLLAIAACFISNNKARRVVLKTRKRVGKWGV